MRSSPPTSSACATSRCRSARHRRVLDAGAARPERAGLDLGLRGERVERTAHALDRQARRAAGASASNGPCVRAHRRSSDASASSGDGARSSNACGTLAGIGAPSAASTRAAFPPRCQARLAGGSSRARAALFTSASAHAADPDLVVAPDRRACAGDRAGTSAPAIGRVPRSLSTSATATGSSRSRARARRPARARAPNGVDRLRAPLAGGASPLVGTRSPKSNTATTRTATPDAVSTCSSAMLHHVRR